MSEFDDKLGAILSDQNAMEQIMALAQSLSGPKNGDESAEEGPSGGEAAPLLLPDRGQDIQLLAALRPYLRPERQRRIDRMVDVLRLLRLMKSGEA